MLKGINQWCFVPGTPLETVFSVSREAGFDMVELDLFAPGGVGLTMETTAREAEQVGKLAASFGIKLGSLSTRLFWQFPLSSADDDVREQGRLIVRKQLELAELLGMDTVLIVPGTVDEETSYEQCYNRSQKQLLDLAFTAERRKVRIAIENVWNRFLLSPLDMVRFVDEIGSPWVGVYFDVGNVLQFGYPQQWIRFLKQRIFKVHVKDYRLAVGTLDGFVPLLSGDVNWRAVIGALREIGYRDTLVAEVDPYGSDPMQSVFDISRQLDLIASLQQE